MINLKAFPLVWPTQATSPIEFKREDSFTSLPVNPSRVKQEKPRVAYIHIYTASFAGEFRKSLGGRGERARGENKTKYKVARAEGSWVDRLGYCARENEVR